MAKSSLSCIHLLAERTINVLAEKTCCVDLYVEHDMKGRIMGQNHRNYFSFVIAMLLSTRLVRSQADDLRYRLGTLMG